MKVLRDNKITLIYHYDLLPMTLTYKFDLRRAKVNHHVKCLVQVISFRRCYLDRNTDTQQAICFTSPLKWPEKKHTETNVFWQSGPHMQTNMNLHTGLRAKWLYYCWTGHSIGTLPACMTTVIGGEPMKTNPTMLCRLVLLFNGVQFWTSSVTTPSGSTWLTSRASLEYLILIYSFGWRFSMPTPDSPCS